MARPKKNPEAAQAEAAPKVAKVYMVTVGKADTVFIRAHTKAAAIKAATAGYIEAIEMKEWMIRALKAEDQVRDITQSENPSF
jgi:hypothetical protein